MLEIRPLSPMTRGISREASRFRSPKRPPCQRDATDSLPSRLYRQPALPIRRCHPNPLRFRLLPYGHPGRFPKEQVLANPTTKQRGWAAFWLHERSSQHSSYLQALLVIHISTGTNQQPERQKEVEREKQWFLAQIELMKKPCGISGIAMKGCRHCAKMPRAAFSGGPSACVYPAPGAQSSARTWRVLSAPGLHALTHSDRLSAEAATVMSFARYSTPSPTASPRRSGIVCDLLALTRLPASKARIRGAPHAPA